jgi:hypothetical protein
VKIYAQGNNGQSNVSRTSEFGNTWGDALFCTIRLAKIFKDFKNDLNEITLNVGIIKTIDVSGVETYEPRGDGFAISNLQKIYEDKLNDFLGQRLKESEKNGKLDFSLYQSFVNIQTGFFEKKYGPSPMTQFKRQAIEAIKNGIILKTSTTPIPMLQPFQKR